MLVPLKSCGITDVGSWTIELAWHSLEWSQGCSRGQTCPPPRHPLKSTSRRASCCFNSHPVICSGAYAIFLHCENQVLRHERHRHKRNYEIEHYKPSAEDGGAREGRLGGKEIGTRLVPLFSYISSLAVSLRSQEHTSRWKRERKTESSFVWVSTCLV